MRATGRGSTFRDDYLVSTCPFGYDRSDLPVVFAEVGGAESYST